MSESDKPHQIPLELPVSNAASREDLIIGPANRLAVAAIDTWPDWPASTVILHGPSGSGKSHMARVWAHRAGAYYATMAEIAALSEPISNHLVVEDIHPGEIEEKALFHVLNQLRAEQLNCLMTSRFLPAQWQLSLADLNSRIAAATHLFLEPPDDEMLRMIIVKLFADRQLSPDPDVVSYLIGRMERSLNAAVMLVAEIDRESLARSRKITRSVAASALQKLGMS